MKKPCGKRKKKVKSIGTILSEISKTVPDSVWRRVPRDLSATVGGAIKLKYVGKKETKKEQKMMKITLNP
jgi:hypothetical protein